MKTWALIGTPNSGKTALFNAMTGGNQRVANYSGVTVESAVGEVQFKDAPAISLVDLPGTYSLNPISEDEQVTTLVLKDQSADLHPDGVIVVLDATQIWRNLSFALEIKDLHFPKVFVVNLSDLAQKRKQKINLEKLSQELGAPVLECVATKKIGIPEIKAELLKIQKSGAVDSSKHNAARTANEQLSREVRNQKVLDRYKQVDLVYKNVVESKPEDDKFSRQLDKMLLHSFFGPLVLILVLAGVFQAVFNLAAAPMEWIGIAFDTLGTWTKSVVPEGNLQSFLVDGLIAGVGGTIVFLPQILILFAAILALEDFGYMARVVVILDRLMSRVGLHSRAFFPLFSSFACAIPGIMSTRAIEDKRDRLTSILMAPLMTCSARLPVYALLISAFIPNETVFAGLGLQGLVLLGLYFIGILAALIVGWVIKKVFMKGPTQPLVIELPGYKIPAISSLLRGLWFRAQMFLKRVTFVIVTLTVIIWVLVSFPKQEGLTSQQQVDQSYAASIGKFIEPAIRPLGFDWRIGMALLPAFAAREVMVSALSTVYAVEEDADLPDAEKEDSLKNKLAGIIQKVWSIPIGLSLMVWFAFSPQCISTLAVVRRETGGWKWAMIMLTYLMALAYAASFLTYRIALVFFP